MIAYIVRWFIFWHCVILSNWPMLFYYVVLLPLYSKKYFPVGLFLTSLAHLSYSDLTLFVVILIWLCLLSFSSDFVHRHSDLTLSIVVLKQSYDCYSLYTIGDIIKGPPQYFSPRSIVVPKWNLQSQIAKMGATVTIQKLLLPLLLLNRTWY